MTTPEQLHMVQVDMSLPHLMRMARRRRFPVRQSDHGYLVHCQLGELFGSATMSPFALRGEHERFVTVLAYSAVPASALRERAKAVAEPATYDAVDWESMAAKELPTTWRKGSRYGFEARVCPVRRMASAGPKHKKGAEVDAFLARCWKVDDDVAVDREAVYLEWLDEEFERRGGAGLIDAEMVRFRRARLLRRTHGNQRVSRLCERPDVRLRGTLQVTDGEAFSTMLARGLGRHRAFGFGMLLLRPVS